MKLYFEPVSQEEYELVKPHFKAKATELMKSQDKQWAWVNFDNSKYLKLIIDGQKFVIAAGNVMSAVIGDVLPSACQQYPEKFGTRNAYDVLDALYEIEPTGNKDGFQNFLSTEQFALVFKINDDNSVDEKVLRLDLFRMIKNEKENKENHEFIGGLLHALKHFKFNEFYLSTNKENYALSNPSDIIPMIIRGFFFSEHNVEEGRKSFTTVTQLDEAHTYRCSFFEEPVINVYFLNSVYIN